MTPVNENMQETEATVSHNTKDFDIIGQPYMMKGMHAIYFKWNLSQCNGTMCSSTREAIKPY